MTWYAVHSSTVVIYCHKLPVSLAIGQLYVMMAAVSMNLWAQYVIVLQSMYMADIRCLTTLVSKDDRKVPDLQECTPLLERIQSYVWDWQRCVCTCHATGQHEGSDLAFRYADLRVHHAADCPDRALLVHLTQLLRL